MNVIYSFSVSNRLFSIISIFGKTSCWKSYNIVVLVKQILQWLSKPFPLVESIRDILLISLGSGIVVMAILLIFKPFGIGDIDRSLFFYLCGYALIDIVVTAIHLFLPRIFPGRKDKYRWTTGKNLALIIWLLFAISFFNYIYGEFLAGKVYVEGFKELHRGGILSWFFMTLSVGIIPLVFALYFIEKRLLSRNQLRADEFNSVMQESLSTEKEIQISIGSGNDAPHNIKLADLICIRAEGGNYATVFWQDGNETNKKLMRLTLVGFLKQIDHMESIVRCHKSYVINLDQVVSFQGNARSVTVLLNGLKFEVPVSRSFPREKLSKPS